MLPICEHDIIRYLQIGNISSISNNLKIQTVISYIINYKLSHYKVKVMK
jgi:hypothetical protein